MFCPEHRNFDSRCSYCRYKKWMHENIRMPGTASSAGMLRGLGDSLRREQLFANAGSLGLCGSSYGPYKDDTSPGWENMIRALEECGEEFKEPQ